MKKIATLMLTFIVLAVSTITINYSQTQNSKKEQFTDFGQIILGTNEIYHNNDAFIAQGKSEIVKGSTFVSLRSLATLLDLTIQYDGMTKTFSVYNRYNKITFVVDADRYFLNGSPVDFGTLKPYSKEDVLMVPLKTFTAPFNVSIEKDRFKNAVNLYWNTFVPGQFSIKEKKIYATQTQVTFLDDFTRFSGEEILDEMWTGKYDVYPEAGEYTITRSILTDDGVWQTPYVLTIEVLPPNQPPVAEFKTNKDVYKIGETLRYYDYSRDDEDAIAKIEWTNKEPAFFTAGEHDISLKVTDEMGLSHEMTKTITITEEVLYTKEEYSKLNTPIGEKYTIEGSQVPQLEKIRYTVLNTGYTLFRSNSPESAKEDGIYYEDIISGPTRVLIHHLNLQKNPVKYYLMASNPGDEPVTFTMPYSGVGGPHQYITLTGKAGVTKYLQSLSSPNKREITLKPGEKALILTRLNAIEVPHFQTISAHADVYTTKPLKLQMIILDSQKDIDTYYRFLKPLGRDEVHRRGTFENATKHITITERVGDTPSRLSLSDGTRDTNYPGVDAMTGDEMYNDGIYGVVHEVVLDEVAPNTIISINPRGGEYSGTFRVNGQIIETTRNSHLTSSNEAVVLYRTGNQAEKVEIYYIPASGSSLPLAMLFEQMPPIRY